MRRIATLVAQGVQPEELFAAVAEETAATFDAITGLMRFEHDPPGVVLVGVSEETGLLVRITEPLDSIEYWFVQRGTRIHKTVHYFLMQPIGERIYATSVVPLRKGSVDAVEAVERASPPMRDFMLKYARQKDLALFVDLAKEPRPSRPADLSMRVVVPAYMLSELKAGFQIGAVLFLPFLVIDLVVAAITTSIGMLQLPPVVISTPLKVLLFVMVDGWNLVVGSLMKSFA